MHPSIARHFLPLKQRQDWRQPHLTYLHKSSYATLASFRRRVRIEMRGLRRLLPFARKANRPER